MVDSCRTCSACAEDLEQFCENGSTLTYGGVEKETGKITQGGYSRAIVVDQDFCLHVSSEVDLAATAPLLCAGITTYSPLRHWNVGEARRSAWSGSAASATWRSSWPRRWAPR